MVETADPTVDDDNQSDSEYEYEYEEIEVEVDEDYEEEIVDKTGKVMISEGLCAFTISNDCTILTQLIELWIIF